MGGAARVNRCDVTYHEVLVAAAEHAMTGVSAPLAPRQDIALYATVVEAVRDLIRSDGRLEHGNNFTTSEWICPSRELQSFKRLSRRQGIGCWNTANATNKDIYILGAETLRAQARAMASRALARRASLVSAPSIWISICCIGRFPARNSPAWWRRLNNYARRGRFALGAYPISTLARWKICSVFQTAIAAPPIRSPTVSTTVA